MQALVKKGRKKSIQLFTENMIKELLGWIMEKHLDKIETMEKKSLSYYKIMILNIQVINQKSFTKKTL